MDTDILSTNTYTPPMDVYSSPIDLYTPSTTTADFYSAPSSGTTIYSSVDSTDYSTYNTDYFNSDLTTSYIPDLISPFLLILPAFWLLLFSNHY